MARATNAQVQQFVNERIRKRAEAVRLLLAQMQDDKAAIDDVYEHCSGANGIAPTWTDIRPDGPPHLLGPNDVTAYNSFITALINNIANAADYPVIKKASVNAV